ncbi:MAG TPA: alpha/beta hydrolase [Pyrinomonadaceae bacterium]|jgi:pimeloyl-ACP methyl ester carboxylesterase
MSPNIENLKHDYAQIGGVRLHYVTAGEGEKLVILLHGFPEFWYSWRNQIPVLSETYTVVAPDLRGYNLSDKPANVGDYEIGKIVDDVLGLIRHFGREQAAIVGHDFGAAVAWRLAQKHPESIWKLCAMQVPPVSVWRKNQTLRQFLASWYMFFFQLPFLPELFLSANDYAALEKSLRKTSARPDVFTDEVIEEYRKSWRETEKMTSPLNYYRANILKRFFGKQSTGEKIQVPTLFIYGEKDHAILPETVRGVSEAVEAPFSEFRLPEAAHWVQQEAADDVNEVLLDFLAD